MEIQSIIEKYIVDEIMLGDKNTVLNPDQSLMSSGIIDSLAILRLISFVEERFGIVIDDEEVIPENFETINAMKTLIEAKL